VAELSVVFAAVLAAAADAVLVAYHPPKLGARLATALATSRGLTSTISAVVPVNIAPSSFNDLAHRLLEVLCRSSANERGKHEKDWGDWAQGLGVGEKRSAAVHLCAPTQ
jgi:hypothetical protein